MKSLFLSLLTIFACEGQEPRSQTAKATIQEISVTELHDRMKSGNLLIVDVRSTSEYGQGHVPGAQSIPLQELESRADQLPREGDIYLICAVGGRSHRAATFLAAQGFQNPINILGGSRAWRDQGYRLE